MIEIDVSEALKRQGGSFQYAYTGTPALNEIDLAEPLAIQADYAVVGGGEDIRVCGTYRAVIRAECIRCLDEVACAIDGPFDEIFSKTAAGEEGYAYQGQVISLDKMIYDDITLNTPQHLLCGEACRGLCPRCGANRNRQNCTCGEDGADDMDGPFSQLKNLF
jgi:uncharacterized protein